MADLDVRSPLPFWFGFAKIVCVCACVYVVCVHVFDEGSYKHEVNKKEGHFVMH